MRSTLGKIDQLAFTLFDNSDNTSDPASPGPTANAVALGATAAKARSERNGKHGNRPSSGHENTNEKDQLLGKLLWFTISNAVRLKPDPMAAAITESSLDPEDLLPRPPGAAAALTRAGTDAQLSGVKLETDRKGNVLDADYYANILLRSAGRGVKQVVTEILKDDGAGTTKRLYYQPLASAWIDDDRLVVERLHDHPLLDPEAEALSRLEKYFEFEKERYDGEAVRSVMGRTFDLAEAIPLRNSGGMYFIPDKHAEYADHVLSFVGEVRRRAENSLKRVARASTAFTVPLVDRKEYRELLEDSLDAHVEKEARALISEMRRAIKGDTGVTRKRQQTFIDRIKALKSNVKTYEQMLEMEAQGARDNLDVAMKQAKKLLTDAAEAR